MIRYPEDFFNYSNGIDVDEMTIIKWLNENKEYLLKSKDNLDISYVASGNAIVIGIKDEDGYEFIVCKDYKAFNIGKDEVELPINTNINNRKEK